MVKAGCPAIISLYISLSLVVLNITGSAEAAFSVSFSLLIMTALSLIQQAEVAGSTWMLENMIETIQQAKFTIYRINEKSSLTTFLSLGMSIVLNRPFLMIKDAQSEVPVDLRDIGLYQFPNLISLEREFVTRHQGFLEKYT